MTLPTGVGLAAYRILQESLANASRHAPGAAVRAEVDVHDGVLKLVVHNTTAPRLVGPTESGGGSGLVGARTRAQSAGGALTAGPTPDGGFRVEATLPVPPLAEPGQ